MTSVAPHITDRAEQSGTDERTARPAAMAPAATSLDQDLHTELARCERELGVIKEAQRRRRRRRLASASAMLASCALASAIIFGSGGGAKPRHAPPRGRAASVSGVLTSPAAVFVKDPYMGVACHLANSIACDRVGLAVWLRHRATVTATIAGAPLRLNAPRWSYSVRDGRHMLYVYAGFLQPAGLRSRLHVTPLPNTQTWLGSDVPSPLVRFRIDFGQGNVVITQERVWLSAGWG
jgi:hypothetical protein